MSETQYDPKGLARCSANYGEEYAKKLFDRVAEHDADYSLNFQKFVFGFLYDRSVLDQKTRELCAVAALMMAGLPAQMRVHFSGSKSYGATDDEIREVILQTVVYGGIARGMWALAEFEKWKKDNLMGFGDARVGATED
jgi:4-carboxymuconolactone decarboxylase